jgi:hypothetical protein
VPRNTNSYHTGNSVMQETGKEAIVLNGVKYQAVNSPTAKPTNLDFQ